MGQTKLAEAPSKPLPIGKVAIALAVAAALVVFGREAGGYVPRFAAWVDGLGVWGPAVFMAGYALATVAFVPASALTLAAGAIFGLLAGVLYVFVAASIGACLAFLVSRNFARAAVEKRVAGDQRFVAIDRAVGEQGRKIVFLLRLSPVFPFNLLNYALGLTNVRFVDYALACTGMLPGTVLYVYLGFVGGGLAAAAGAGTAAPGAGTYLVQLLGLLATVVVTVLVTRTAKKALQEATGTAARGGSGETAG